MRKKDVPALLMVDPRRRVLVIALVLALGLLIYAALARAGLWRSLMPQTEALRVLMGLAASYLVVRLGLGLYAGLLSAGLFRSRRAFRLLAQGDNEGAIAIFQQVYNFFDRYRALERWRALIFFDATRYGYRELMLINQAHAHIHAGRIDEALRCYEQALALNPDNEMAEGSVRLARLARGEPVQPRRGIIPLTRLADPGLRRRLGWIVTGITLVLLPCEMAFLIPFLTEYGIWTAAALVVGISLFVGYVLPMLWRFASTRFLLMDFYRGRKHLEAGRHEEALAAFEEQLAFFRENPAADRYRWLFFLHPSTYSYQELIGLYVAYTYGQVGDLAKMVGAYREILTLNPDNGYADSVMKFIDAVRGSSQSG